MKTLYNYIEKSILENKAENDDPLAKTYPNEEWNDDIELKEKINAILDKLKKNDSLADSISIANAYRVEGEEYLVIRIFGGENGPGKWEKYLTDIKKIVSEFDGWVISLDNDVLDDVWDLHIGVQEKNIKDK